jgi:hypothetical protein
MGGPHFWSDVWNSLLSDALCSEHVNWYTLLYVKGKGRHKVKVEVHPYSFFNLGARWEFVSNATPQAPYHPPPPENNPLPIVYEAGWVPGSVWTGAENLPPPHTGMRSPDSRAGSESLYRLSYPSSSFCVYGGGGAVAIMLKIRGANVRNLVDLVTAAWDWRTAALGWKCLYDTSNSSHNIVWIRLGPTYKYAYSRVITRSMPCMCVWAISKHRPLCALRNSKLYSHAVR